MIYPYKCSCCGNKFDVIKAISDFDREESCPGCHTVAQRYIASTGSFYGAGVEDAVYCPGLGCIVNNSQHRAKIAKERGLVEIGNEDTNKWYDNAQKDKESEIQRFYDDVGTDRIVLGSR